MAAVRTFTRRPAQAAMRLGPAYQCRPAPRYLATWSAGCDALYGLGPVSLHRRAGIVIGLRADDGCGVLW